MIFLQHTGQNSFNCLEWIQCYMRLYQEAPSLEVISLKEESREIRKFDRTTMQYISATRNRNFLRTVKINKGDDSRQYLRDIARKFASYLKHKERSQKDGRAIASANMIMRMFLHVTEMFHLRLSDSTVGPTITCQFF